LKRSLFAVAIAGAFGIARTLGSGKVDAARPARPAASPTASATPAPLPTATPEPPNIAIPRLQTALRANPNDRQALSELAMQYLSINHPELALPLTQRLIAIGEKTAQVYFYQGSAEAALAAGAAFLASPVLVPELAPACREAGALNRVHRGTARTASS